MIDQPEWGTIRTLFQRGLSKKEIARQLGLDIKTVRKWLSREWEPQRRRPRGRVLDQWSEFLRARAPEVGFNGVVLLRELRELGCESCAYATLVKYIKPWRDSWRGGIEPTVRFETPPGKQSQVDWGSTAVWFDSGRRRVHLFVMVLGFSRRIFAKGYENERIDSLLDGHGEAFDHFGGRTEKILYDNPRTIVLRKDPSSGEVEWNRKFKDRMDYYGVDIQLCSYYRAQTKGKVESGIKYLKRNALAGRRFRDLDHLNEWLAQWCVEVADERIHGTTHERPSERFKRAEAEHLIKVDGGQSARRERVERRLVGSDGYVAVETNRYPVNYEWVGRQVEVRVLADQVIISNGEEPPLSYSRLAERHAVARWDGKERHLPRKPPEMAIGPPRFDPAYCDAGVVDVRPLECYESLAEGVML